MTLANIFVTLFFYCSPWNICLLLNDACCSGCTKDTFCIEKHCHNGDCVKIVLLRRFSDMKLNQQRKFRLNGDFS